MEEGVFLRVGVTDPVAVLHESAEELTLRSRLTSVPLSTPQNPVSLVIIQLYVGSCHAQHVCCASYVITVTTF